MFLKRLKKSWATTQEIVNLGVKLYLCCVKTNTNISLNNLLMTNGLIVKSKTPSIPLYFFLTQEKR
jgi:hypothetical protein